MVTDGVIVFGPKRKSVIINPSQPTDFGSSWDWSSLSTNFFYHKRNIKILCLTKSLRKSYVPFGTFIASAILVNSSLKLWVCQLSPYFSVTGVGELRLGGKLSKQIPKCFSSRKLADIDFEFRNWFGRFFSPEFLLIWSLALEYLSHM